eukprot:jgi/Chrzof1/3348/Cz12g21220.t1
MHHQFLSCHHYSSSQPTPPGGAVSSKNVVATIMECFVALGLVTMLWTFYGFSLSFGADAGYPGFIGKPETYGLFHNVGAAPEPSLAPTIPLTVFALYQLMFAIITPTLIIGSFAERVNFPALCLFVFFWHTLVYCPLAHMTWHPQGLLRMFGVLDFAGGTVVHMSSGYAAVVGALFLGPSLKDTSGVPKEPANVPFVILGTTLLWFGWFGFNAGSAIGASSLAGQAFLTTNSAAAAAMMTWLLMDNLRGKKSRATGVCFGAVVGLVAVTPSAGFVTIGGAMVIGIVAGIICNCGQKLMEHLKSRVDDTLDVFACHGLGGTVGMISTSLFATTSANPAGANGLFYGDATLFWKTIVALLGVVAYVVLFSYFCYYLTNFIIPMRASEAEEKTGLDVTKHGERVLASDISVYNGMLHSGGSFIGQVPADLAITIPDPVKKNQVKPAAEMPQ